MSCSDNFTDFSAISFEVNLIDKLDLDKIHGEHDQNCCYWLELHDHHLLGCPRDNQNCCYRWEQQLCPHLLDRPSAVSQTLPQPATTLNEQPSEGRNGQHGVYGLAGEDGYAFHDVIDFQQESTRQVPPADVQQNIQTTVTHGQESEARKRSRASELEKVLDIDVLIGYSGSTRDSLGQRKWREICGDRRKASDEQIKSMQNEHREAVRHEFFQKFQCEPPRDPMFLVKWTDGDVQLEIFEWTRPCTKSGNGSKTDHWVKAPMDRIIKYVVSYKGKKSTPTSPTAATCNSTLCQLKDADVSSGMDDATFAAIRSRISACHEINDFVDVYCNSIFEACMRRITDAQCGRDRLVWAKDWAEKLRQKDQHAESLNLDRKVCLELLYKLCDRWKPKGTATAPEVSESDIVNVFKDNKVKRILYGCLVMDRANALYNMHDCVTNLRGMNWYSHNHSAWRDACGNNRGNSPTINKRLTWLFEIQGLGLCSEEFLTTLMEPCCTPLTSPASP